MEAAVQEAPIINFLARLKHSVQIQFYPCSGRTFSLGTWLFWSRILLSQYLEVSMERGNCYISPPYCSKLLHFNLILLPREKILWRQDYRDWRTNHVWEGGEWWWEHISDWREKLWILSKVGVSKGNYEFREAFRGLWCTGAYILKGGARGARTPQTIWNCPQKDCLRTLFAELLAVISPIYVQSLQ